MSLFTTRDGTQIYYKDWGSGPVVSFSHGWPLSADAWEAQMFHLASQGFRCIATGISKQLHKKIQELFKRRFNFLAGVVF